MFNAPSAPTTISEALQQRLEKYQSEVVKANETSNASKARRMTRIVKQYEEAIALYKKGGVVPFDELPTPPGFAPIPLVAPPPAVQQPPPVPPTPGQNPMAPKTQGVSPEKPETIGRKAGTSPGTGSINMGGKTLQQKQLDEVLQRQKDYKEAAIEAKKRGDINQAREYLRISKGFDNLIEASKGGLPVDLKTVHMPPI